QVGAGLQIKIGHNYLTLSSNVLWMTRNLVNESERMSNSQLVYTYGYVDDDFVQMLPQFSIGVKRIIYNPRLINP
ncbi:MAG: hypothetical protein AB8H47_20975, partial [Bacteroidia bacterium]